MLSWGLGDRGLPNGSVNSFSLKNRAHEQCKSMYGKTENKRIHFNKQLLAAS